MDLKSRRIFVNNMMMATAAAMSGQALFGQQATGVHTVPDTAPPYLQLGNVQQGPDGVNGNPPPGPIGAGGPAGGGARAGGAGAGGRAGGGGGARTPRPKPAGISWITGTGTEEAKAVDWIMENHVKKTMDRIKSGVERQGGTMESFLYMQVFICLRNDDSTPKPKGSAGYAAYQKAYEQLNSVYYSKDYWPNGPESAPPRSVFALDWIPGSSLIEITAAYYIDPSVVPPPAPPRAPRGGAAPPA